MQSEPPAERTEPPTTGAPVLVVDDDPELREIVRAALQREGFSVAEAADGETALEAVEHDRPRIVVLDLGLPRLGGLKVLRRLRAAGEIPVIILSGRGDEADRIVGLELGADDYVTKPFSPRELAVRVKAVLRRGAAAAQRRLLEFQGLTIDPGAREVAMADGSLVELTAREFDLLHFLARSPRQVFSADQLLRQVWGSDPGWQTPSTVSEHVYRVRRKIESDPRHPRWIRTVRGAGYRFEP